MALFQLPIKIKLRYGIEIPSKTEHIYTQFNGLYVVIKILNAHRKKYFVYSANKTRKLPLSRFYIFSLQIW